MNNDEKNNLELQIWPLDFLNWLFQSGKSKGTSRAYYLEVCRCLDSKEKTTSTLSQINDRLKSYVNQDGLSPSTINRRYQALLLFCKFINVKPSFTKPKKNPPPLIQIQLPTTCSSESRLRLSLPKKTKNLRRWQLTSLRNKAMTWLTVICGFKISEISELQVKAVKIIDDKVFVENTLLPSQVRTAVLEYLMARSSKDFDIDGESDFLFVNNQGLRLSVRTIQHGIKRYLIDCKTPENMASVSKARLELTRLVSQRVNFATLLK